MEDVKARLKTAELELEKIEQRRNATFRRLTASMKRAQAVMDYAEKELKRAMSEPSAERREQLTTLNELRRQGAQTNLEMLQLLANMDVTKPIAHAAVKRIDELCLRTQWITMEFNTANYKNTMAALEAALDMAPTPAAAEAAPAAKPATGPLGRPGMPAAGARPGMMPPRPPAPAGKTAPLPARPAVPGAPAAPVRPGLPPRPAAPGARPPVAGTGPLGARPGVNRPGSGPLKGNAAALAVEAQAKLIADLKAAAEDAETREKLRTLHDRVKDLEVSLAPLRGDLPGELALSLNDAGNQIRQIAGKVYFVNRTLAGLGDLGNRIPFESRDFDPGVMEVLESIAPDAEPTAEPRPSEAPADAGASLAGRLKSLFKS